MTDPRNDLLVREPWDAMTEQLRGVVRGLDAPDAGRNALRAVIDLHVAWEHRRQLLDGSGVDVVTGVGCRSCDWQPDLRHVTTPWCPTVEALRISLIDEALNLHVIPADTADQAAAWYRGYADSNINRKAREDWERHGGDEPHPEMLACPYRDA